VARPKLDKPKPFDYAVMIGGPAVFLLLAWLGVTSLIGPPPAVNPVQRLRTGMVKAGMTQSEVERLVGPPRAVVDGEEGRVSYRYQKSTWEPDRRTFIEEDAYVDFGPDGTVSGVSFDSRTPSQPQ